MVYIGLYDFFKNYLLLIKNVSLGLMCGWWRGGDLYISVIWNDRFGKTLFVKENIGVTFQ